MDLLAADVPVIDLGLILAPNSEATHAARRDHLEALARACRACGTFAIRNHGLPVEVPTSLLQLAKEYFSLPTETKEDAARSGEMVARGYRCHDFPNGARHETYHWNENFERVQASGVGDPGIDPWPDEPAHFRDVIRSSIVPFKALSQRILRAVALSADLAPDALDFLAEFGSLQLHHYDVGTRLSEHTDLAPLTVIFAGSEGLEVKHPGAGWSPAKATDGVLCCMLGDAFLYLTNDHYTTSVHRVASISVPRESVLWAPICGPDATIGPFPRFCSDATPARYPARPVTDVVRDWVAEHT